jgi:hypothetical protein
MKNNQDRNFKKGMAVLFFLPCLFFHSYQCDAQLKGHNLLGDFGLQSGTVAPPSFTILVPVYVYDAAKLKNSKGDVVNTNPDLSSLFTGIGASWVSEFKILNANLNSSVLFAFAKTRIEGNTVQTSTSFAFSDMYVQPVKLGWHGKMADYTAGYALFLPTGKYEQGGDNNSGLGMLSNEFSAGATQYFNAKKTFSFSTLLSYEIHSDKKNTDIKAGNILSIEGGLGKSHLLLKDGKIPQALVNAGIVYYMQYKVSSDHIPVGNTTFTGTKDHIYGVGLESNIYMLKPSLSVGFRWLAELGAVNRFQGNTFFLSVAKVFMHKEAAKK